MNNFFKKGFASLVLASAMVLLLFGSWISANDENTSAWHENEMPLMFALEKPNSGEKILFHLVAGKLTIEASKQNHMIVLSAKRLGSESVKPLTFVVNRPHSDQKIFLSVHDNKIAIRDTKNEKIHLFYDTGLSSATSATLITNEPAYKIALQSGKSLLFSVIHAKPSAVATTTDGKVINQNTLTATNLLDANKYGKALASSVIYAKDSVVATTTVGTAANNTYIINANSDLDVNNSGKGLSFSVINAKPSAVATTNVGTAANNTYIINANSDLDVNNSGKGLSFSVIHAKPSAVTAAKMIIKDANNINSTSSNVNTGSNISFAKSFEKTFINKFNKENGKIHKYAGATNVVGLDITTDNTVAVHRNNTENVKINAYFKGAYFTYNSDTIGAATRAFQDGDKKSIGEPFSA